MNTLSINHPFPAKCITDADVHQAKFRASLDAQNESTTMDKVLRILEKLSLYICGDTLDVAKFRLYELFRTDLEYQKATDSQTKARCKRETIGAFNALKELFRPEDQDKFQLSVSPTFALMKLSIHGEEVALLDQAKPENMMPPLGSILWNQIGFAFSRANKITAMEVLNKMCRNDFTIKEFTQGFVELSKLTDNLSIHVSDGINAGEAHIAFKYLSGTLVSFGCLDSDAIEALTCAAELVELPINESPLSKKLVAARAGEISAI